MLKKFLKLFTIPSANKMRYFPNTYDVSSASKIKFEAERGNEQINGYIDKILENVKPVPRNVDGGLYVGATGIAFMLYHLSKNMKSESSQAYLTKAAEYVSPGLQYTDRDKTSFLLGDAGTKAVAAAIFHKLNYHDRASQYVSNYQSLLPVYLDMNFLKCGGDELFVGRAGYIAGALWLSRELGTEVLTQEQLHRVCDIIVASGRQYAKRHRSPCPLMYAYYRTEYLGAAHGVSFILQMLLTVPDYVTSDPSIASDIKATIDYVLSLQSPDGNWPCAMDEISQPVHKLVHWCHGSPGVVYLMARAYLVYGDKKYFTSCIKAGENVWDKGLLRKGPGICHGVAGSGYVFLLLFRLTKDKQYMERAKAFADFLQSDVFLTEARIPDNPYSLYEGTAGTVCFLHDLLHPSTAEFPFQDIFTNYTTG